jgi:hypothetical protein
MPAGEQTGEKSTQEGIQNQSFIKASFFKQTFVE